MAHQLENNTSTIESIQQKINNLPNATEGLTKLNAINGGNSTNNIDTALNNTQTLVNNQNELINTISGELDTKLSPPEKITVLRKSGSFRTNKNGGADVNCGFKPDFVYVRLMAYNYDTYTSLEQLSVVFSEETREGIPSSICWEQNDNGVIDSVWFPTDTGFSVNLWYHPWDWSATASVSYTTFQYVAIKYTE